MRCRLLALILTAGFFGASCESESTAAKYIADSKQGAQDSTTPTAKVPPVDPVVPVPPAATGDLENGINILNTTCSTCHNGSIAKTELNKAVVDKLEGATSQPLHAGVIDNFSSPLVDDIKAALNGL